MKRLDAYLYLSLGFTFRSCSTDRQEAMFILCYRTTCTYTVGWKSVLSVGSLVFGDYVAASSSATDLLTQIAGCRNTDPLLLSFQKMFV